MGRRERRVRGRGVGEYRERRFAGLERGGIGDWDGQGKREEAEDEDEGGDEIEMF